MTNNYDIWNRLTTPFVTVREPIQRRQAQLLAAILLFLMPLGWLAAAAPDLLSEEEVFWTDPEFLLMAGVTVFNVCLYLLSRSRYFRVVPSIAILLACVAIWLAAVPDDSTRDIFALYYLILPIFLSTIFVSIRLSLLVTFLNIAAIIIFPSFFDEVTLQEMVSGPLSFLLILSLFVWLTHYFYQQTLQDQNQRQQQSIMQLRTIYEVTAMVNRADSLPAIYNAALQGLLDALSADRAAVMLVDKNGMMRFKVAAGLSVDYQQKVTGHSPWSAETVAPDIIYIPNIAADGSLRALRDVILAEGIRAIAFIPLTFRDQLLGKFMLYWDDVHPYNETEIQIAQTIATNVSFAVARKQSEQALAQKTSALTHSNALIAALSQVAAHIQAKPDLDGTLETLAEKMRELGLDCWIGIRNASEDTIHYRYSTLTPEQLDRIEEYLLHPVASIEIPIATVTDKWGSRLKEGMYTERASLLVRDIYPNLEEEDVAVFLETLGLQEGTPLMQFELMSDGRLLGLFAVWGLALREADKPAFSVFAMQVAETLHSLQLFQALRAREEQYRFVSELVSDWAYAYWVAPDGSLVWEWTTDAFHRVTGFAPVQSKNEVVWKEEIVHPQDKALVEERLAQLLAGKPDTSEYRIIDATGNVRWVRDYALPVWDETAQRVTRILGAAQDITELQQTKERMMQQRKMESLGLMAGGVAHDFNNLLVSLMGQSSIALAKLAPDAAARPHVQKAIRTAEQAADLTWNILAYSGGGHMKMASVDLTQMLEELLPLLHATLPTTIRLHVQMAESLPQLQADASQVQRIISNLVANAAEAIGDNAGNVWIETSLFWYSDAAEMDGFVAGTALAYGRYVLISIRDDGCGMDEETQSKVFDPFFSTKFTGRGLGLAAVLGIVQSHKGAIRLESNPGQGTRLDLFFPTVEDDATQAETAVLTQRD